MMRKTIPETTRHVSWRGAAVLRGERGNSLVELALLLPFLLLLLVGVVDFGRAYYLLLEVASAAHAGALYGTQNPTDTANMQAAATLDAPDVPGITATATYGCECSDGTAASASCTATPSCTSPATVVNYVQVDTSAAYTPWLTYPGVSLPSSLTGSARMRAGL